jgi:hypothetical protein
MEPGQTGRRIAARARLIALGSALLAASAAAASEVPISLGDIARTGDLVCELTSSAPRIRTVRRGPDLLLVFDQVRLKNGVARVVSSRRAGGRPVKVYAGETGLHLVEDVTGSFIVTTLLGCEARDASARRCVRFAAVNAWHFDHSVHRTPDTAFRRLPGTSYAGFCEAWHMEEPKRVLRQAPDEPAIVSSRSAEVPKLRTHVPVYSPLMTAHLDSGD